MLEVVRSVRRFAASFAYNLPAQVFIQRSSAAGAVRAAWPLLITLNPNPEP